MKIVVLGLVTDDVNAEYRKLQALFHDAIGSALAGESFGTSIQTIFFTPMLTRPGVGPFPDKISYLRKEPAVNVAINLSYAQWIEGNWIDHVNMFADALIRAIDQIKDGKFCKEAKTALNRVIEAARRSLTE